MRSDASSPVGLVRAGLTALTSADVVGLPDEQVRGEILDVVTGFFNSDQSSAEARGATNLQLTGFRSVAGCADAWPAFG